jgi:phage-related protein
MSGLDPKELVWIGSSRKDLRGFPQAVRRVFGVALFAVQLGEMPPEAKPLKGFGGAGVLELIEDHDRGSYRAVYTVRFASKVYVLHAFQKKSKRGIATPKHEIELIRERLKTAERLHRNRENH